MPASGTRSRLAETLTVISAEATEMVLSVRLAFFVVVYGSIGALIGWGYVSADRNSMQEGDTVGKLTEFSQRIAEVPAEQRPALIEQFAQEGGPGAAYLARVVLDTNLPLLAMTVLEVSSYFLPLLILLVGYNRIAEDRQTRYTRYILQRVHRETYLIGKIVGHALVCWAAIVLIQAVWIALAAAFGIYGVDQMMAEAPRIWLGMTVYVFAYSAFTMLVSTIFPRPIVALMLGTILMFFLWFAINMAAAIVYPPLTYGWLSAWYMYLWQSNGWAFLVFITYALVFSALAGLMFRRADL